MTRGIPAYKKLPLSKHLKIIKNFVTLPQQYIYNISIFVDACFHVYATAETQVKHH